jgi:hypothetical protein
MGYLQLSRTLLASQLNGFFRPVAGPIVGAAGSDESSSLPQGNRVNLITRR